jgi:hypothetical protein
MRKTRFLQKNINEIVIMTWGGVDEPKKTEYGNCIMTTILAPDNLMDRVERSRWLG